jgi:thiamine biosynthesis protein ThiS
MTSAQDITISANGKTYQVQPKLIIPDFLQQLQLSPNRVVVEYNQQALTPAEMKQQTLSNGDSLEIVKVVAGG